MAMIVMSGFLVGPPLIGFVAEAFHCESHFGPFSRLSASPIDPYLSDIGINDGSGRILSA
jgi:hypothetical protein